LACLRVQDVSWVKNFHPWGVAKRRAVDKNFEGERGSEGACGTWAASTKVTEFCPNHKAMSDFRLRVMWNGKSSRRART